MAKDVISQGIAHNALAQGTFVKGDIFAEGDLRVDGKIEGNINCQGKVVVGAKGEVTGYIKCENAELMGVVTGNIEVSNNVSLKKNCIYQGGMTTQTLDIEPGAKFNGSCEMRE